MKYKSSGDGQDINKLESHIILILKNMLKSAVDHNEVSAMISNFMPEIHHHHSLGKRNQGALANIWENQDHIPAIRWAKCIAKGVTLTLFAGVLALLTKTSSKKIFLDRALLSPR